MKGTLLKLRSKLSRGKVSYTLPIGSDEVELNDLIGKNISLEFTGNIYCIDSGKKIKKSYNNGYSYESFISKAACDTCIVQPEKCHYHLGTCREPLWGEEHCMIPHYIYLSVTSGIKVGITRSTQIPTRWIDQGAEQAIIMLEVPNRFSAGKVEVLLKSEFADKTAWRKMLSSSPEDIDLEKISKTIIKKYKKEFESYGVKVPDLKKQKIKFPIENYPEKISSLGFDKTALIEGKLEGIKGQYLYINRKVLNIRKHQGYEIVFGSN